MWKSKISNDVVFEDVADDILVMENSFVQLEPFGSFPVSDFSKSDADHAKHNLSGGEI